MDLLKAVAMVMVVSLHAGTWYVDFLEKTSLSTILEYAVRLLSEGVPIFIMVNGYLLFSKTSFNLRKHLKKTGKVLLLLVSWSLILAVLGSVINGTELTLGSIWQLFINTKTGSAYTGVMWFMQAMLALYLVYPLLKSIYDSSEKIFNYVFLIVWFFTSGISAIAMGVTVQEILLPDRTLASEALAWLGRMNPIANGSFVLFFVLGGMIKRYEDRIRNNRTACIICGVFAFLASLVWCVTISFATGDLVSPSFDYSSIFTPFILVALYCVFSAYKGNHAYGFVRSIGSNTLGIYFLHMIFIWLISPYFVGAALAQRIIELFLVFLLSYIASFVLAKTPVLRLLVSMRIRR